MLLPQTVAEEFGNTEQYNTTCNILLALYSDLIVRRCVPKTQNSLKIQMSFSCYVLNLRSSQSNVT